jgi:hypothetical protein
MEPAIDVVNCGCASRAGIRTRDLPGNESCCYPSSLPASGSVFSLPVVFTLTLVLLNKQQIHSSGEVLRDLSLCAGTLGSDTTEGRIRIYILRGSQLTAPIHRDKLQYWYVDVLVHQVAEYASHER